MTLPHFQTRFRDGAEDTTDTAFDRDSSGAESFVAQACG
jgi:hypothetical protein